MGNYIVRVLRREQIQSGKSIHMDGVVETADSRKRRAFHNADELWAALQGLEETGHGRQHDK